MQDISKLTSQAALAIQAVKDLSSLEAIRIEYLGKKGRITELLKALSNLSAEEKPIVGQLVNQAKRDILAFIEEKNQRLMEALLDEKLADQHLDLSLPGRYNASGSRHPVTYVKQFIIDYFSRLGFDIINGPEVETEFYNFEALNIAKSHPARAMHDTFYFGDGHLLRTHTSPVQIHAMERGSPPFRLIAPGRVYRCDSDLTHTPMFHQVEGLYIDEDVNMTHLRGTLEDFFQSFFGKKLELRFRPSYFPFTEPSAEVDLQCTHCLGQGCRSCKFTGWLEVLGAGMVHPHVLREVNISPDSYQGWAFGLGMDRLAMLYFGIDDLRLMFESDLAFLRQF